jgi:hypothetical protein
MVNCKVYGQIDEEFDGSSLYVKSLSNLNR